MRRKCLSVQNPLSYLICAGLKDVENRSRSTKHRGTVYIHSCVEYAYKGLLDLSFLPLPVYNDFFEITDEEGKFLREGEYFGVDFHKKQFFLKVAENQPENIVRKYHFLQYIYEKSIVDPEQTIFHNKAIIGKANVVDVVRDAESEWATEDSFHWILDNAELFKEPILNVKGRLGFWYVNLPEDPEPVELY